jgi:uncharacterized membrane protein
MMGFGLIGIVLVVAVIIFLSREGTGLQGLVGYRQLNRQMLQNENVNALDILNQRYARGEITREQFQSIKQDLE